MVLKSAPIEFVFPTGNHQRGHGVAGHIDDRAAHAEKTVDAQYQRHTGNRNRGNDHHGGNQSNERGSLHDACTFGGEKGNTQDRELLQNSQVRVCGLSYEQGGESHVEAGAVSVEGVTRGDYQADESL